MAWIHVFFKGICSKLNATTNLEFELDLLLLFYALIFVTLPTHPRYSSLWWYQSKNSSKMFLQDRLCRVARTKKNVVQQRKKWTVFMADRVLMFWCNITIFILILLLYLYTAIMLCKISLPLSKTDCKFYFSFSIRFLVAFPLISSIVLNFSLFLAWVKDSCKEPNLHGRRHKHAQVIWCPAKNPCMAGQKY